MENVNLVRLLINWLPMLLIVGLWAFFMKSPAGIFANQKRVADALERIANALEKRQ
jgi:ATP-dependent Zn protease